MTSRENDAKLQDHVARLMQFLREMVKARTSPVLDLAEHHEVQWLFPDLVPFQVDNTAVAGDVVLRSPRVTLEDPPELPEQLTDWVETSTEIGNSSGAGPPFRELENFSPSVVRQKHKQFEQWQRKWSTWAQLDRQRRPSYDLYLTLNAMLRDLNAQPESVELVVASGLLALPPKDTGSRRIRTHIVTQEASIERDEHSGDLLVRLVDLTSPRLEDTQLLTEFEVFDASGSLSLQTQLKECSSPVDIAIPVFLKGWAGRALNIQVTVNEEFDAPDAIADRSLSVAPALILRRRGAFALVEYYDKMINLAESGDEKTPLGLAQLVTAIEADERVEWLQSTDATAPRELADDPLFPLPANAEQATIIDQLGSDSGVVVEGPPGTGKTHTIANLVSALLWLPPFAGHRLSGFGSRLVNHVAFECHRVKVAQRAVSSPAVVHLIDPAGHRDDGLQVSVELPPIVELGLQRRPETFLLSVVPTHPGPAHREPHFQVVSDLRHLLRGVLTAPVGMENDLIGRPGLRLPKHHRIP